jgi:hypothetical protein
LSESGYDNWTKKLSLVYKSDFMHHNTKNNTILKATVWSLVLASAIKSASGEEEEVSNEEESVESAEEDTSTSPDGGDSDDSLARVDPARTRAVDPARTRVVDPART